MYQHYIIVASAYSKGTRVGYHMVAEQGQLDIEKINSMLSQLSEISRDDVGIHAFTTKDDSWLSVLLLDSFFEDVLVIGDFDEFLEVLKSDLVLSALDVAKFFLSVKAVSHLKLQKLIYLAYKSYLLKYDHPLFGEKIIAYQYGPVIEEVYNVFRKYGADTIEVDDPPQYRLKDINLSQSIGRLLLVKDAKQVISTLFDTLEVYGDLSARKLVDLTHSINGPWDTVYDKNQKRQITNDIIISQAEFEKL